jgi:hypothetical protein
VLELLSKRKIMGLIVTFVYTREAIDSEVNISILSSNDFCL